MGRYINAEALARINDETRNKGIQIYILMIDSMNRFAYNKATANPIPLYK